MDIRLDSLNPFRSILAKQQPTEEAKKSDTCVEATPQSDSLALSAAAEKSYTPPAESTWYSLKKKVALAASGISVDHSHALTKEQADAVQSQMKPGDVLLRRVDYTSANMVIPGFFGHAAVYAGDGTIIDATTHGVRKVSVQQFFEEGDHAMVIRPKNLSEEEANKIVKYAEKQVGKVYDYDLDAKDDSRFTCTELVNSALTAGTGKKMAEENLAGAVSPDGFKNQNFDLVWTSTPEESKLDQ